MRDEPPSEFNIILKSGERVTGGLAEGEAVVQGRIALRVGGVDVSPTTKSRLGDPLETVLGRHDENRVPVLVSNVHWHASMSTRRCQA